MTDTKDKTPTNKFDPKALRLSQDFASMAGVKKHIITVPVRKPTRHEFVRVHPGEDFQLETLVLNLKEEREFYLVAPNMYSEVADVTPMAIRTCLSKQGALFLWPLRLPESTGRHNSWSESAIEAAQLAEKGWVRIAANMGLGGYDVFEATGNFPEPEWPDLALEKILEIAFKGHYIESPEHIVLRKLRGEV